MMRKHLVAALLALPLLGACESYSPSKQDIGMATGTIPGGVPGHPVGQGRGQTAATVGDAALGPFLGGRIGAGMDRSDQLKTAQALETSKDGQAKSWRNLDTGQYYSVMPTRTYEGASDLCRKFTTVIELKDGRRELVSSTACRQADGTWRTT